MGEIEERTGLEVLDRHECFALLAASSLGRIAVVGDGGRPLIFPVNFALDDEAIVLRSDPEGDLAPNSTESADRPSHPGAWSGTR